MFIMERRVLFFIILALNILFGMYRNLLTFKKIISELINVLQTKYSTEQNKKSVNRMISSNFYFSIDTKPRQIRCQKFAQIKIMTRQAEETNLVHKTLIISCDQDPFLSSYLSRLTFSCFSERY